jgi:hypothetical protein
MTVQTVSPLVAALVDDAGLFPPTALSMPDAVARHRHDLAGGSPVLTHRFLCPASRIGEVRAELTRADRFRIGLIADTGVDGIGAALDEIQADQALELVVVEFPLARSGKPIADVVRSLPATVPVFLEPAVLTDVGALAAAVAELPVGRSVGLKLRCGGLRAELFPTATVLAQALVTAARNQVSVKATAGLHHGIRHTDPATGFTHHGYVNLLVAAAEAAAGADVETVTGDLLATDRDALLQAARDLEGGTVVAARQLFTSYGSCSTTTPRTEARDFGLDTSKETTPQ